MKTKAALVILCLLFSSGYSLFGQYDSASDVPVAWVSKSEVCHSGNDIFFDTNAGPVKLTVLEFDDKTDRYLIKCINFGDEFYPAPEGVY